MKKSILVITSIALIFTVVSRTSADPIKIRSGIHLASAAGMSSSQGYDFIQNFIKAISTNYDIVLEVVRFSSAEEVQEAFIENEIDFALVYSEQYVEIVDAGGKPYPLGTYSINGAPRRALCLWQNKNEGSGDIKETVGKTVLLSSAAPQELLSIRELFYSKGVDKPLWKLFKGFTYSPQQNSAYYSLAMGDADYFFGTSDGKYILKLINPALEKKIGYKICTDSEYSRGSTIINLKTLDSEKVNKLRESFLSFVKNYDEISKKDPGMKGQSAYLKMMKAKYIPADKNQYQTEIALYEKSAKNGWRKEAEYVSEILNKSPGQLVEIKPEFSYCKKLCSEKKSDISCLDDCMH